MESNITHTRGDTFIRNMYFTDSDGNIMDLTGSVIKFSIKVNLSDTEYLIFQTAVLTDPTNGIAKITVSAENMIKNLGTYWYDIQFTDSIGTVETPLKGQFNLTYNVTD